VAINRHRWKWIDDQRARDLLEEAAGRLKRAWNTDKQSDRYPINTWHQLAEIEKELENPPVESKSRKLPPPAPPPQKLSDLVKERTLKAVYEDHNSGSYEEALKQAIGWGPDSESAWRGILRALNLAFFINRYGIENAPRPRVHLLHRRILEITKKIPQIAELNLEGIVELFDDICPCGAKHTSDAIRKLKKRQQKHVRTKP
jgi:hypothetical protein